MHESDDVYAKLTKYQPTTNVPSKCSEEEVRNPTKGTRKRFESADAKVNDEAIATDEGTFSPSNRCEFLSHSGSCFIRVCVCVFFSAAEKSLGS